MPDQNVFDQAVAQYPILSGLGLKAIVTPGGGGGNLLEFWPAGETGSKDMPRPGALPTNAPGVEIYSDKVRPIDVLGDVVSHQLIDSNPRLKSYYEQFATSLTPDQLDTLDGKYAHARQSGDTRSYNDWLTTTGLPNYFRGYAFQQYSPEDVQKMYTPDQIKMFDDMMAYLKSPSHAPTPLSNILNR